MKLKIYLFITIAAILFTASNAAAFRMTFSPRISLTEEYTDNFFLTEDNEEDEYITIISPGFTVELLGQSKGAEISYDPEYVMYNEYSDYDGWRHLATFYGWLDMTRNTRLDIRDAFFKTDDPNPRAIDDPGGGEDPIIPADTTGRDGRETYYTNAASARLTHRFGQLDFFYIEYAHRILRNDDTQLEDSTAHNPSAGLTYWFPAQFGLELVASYTRGEFERSDEFSGSPSDDYDQWNGRLRLTKRFSQNLDVFLEYAHTNMDYDGNTEDYQIYNPLIGLDYSITTNTSLSLDVGYFVRDFEESESESGLTANGALTQTFRNGFITLTGSTGYNEYRLGAENLGFSTFYEIGCEAEYSFTRQFTGDIGASYREEIYEDPEPERKDITRMAGAGLTYESEAWSWLSLRLEYSYREVDSSEDGEDYVENRAFFRITISPDEPFRIIN